MNAVQLPRLGLCCLFRDEPIHFRTATAASLRGVVRASQLAKLSGICVHNADRLLVALQACHRLSIAAFRTMSPLFPLYTHPGVGYALDDLPDAEAIRRRLSECAAFADAHDIRRSLHPDQFVLLNSPRAEVVAASLADLAYQGLLAELIGAEVINLHVGGVYGDKPAALRRFAHVYRELPDAVRQRLSVENDDVSYAPSDLLPISDELGVPVVYDVHHHRCRPDGLDVETATARCACTWARLGREPYFHLSSPRAGWGAGNPRPHADFIAAADIPAAWRSLPYRATIDVEAKAKELAVLALRAEMRAELL